MSHIARVTCAIALMVVGFAALLVSLATGMISFYGLHWARLVAPDSSAIDRITGWVRWE